MKYFIVADIHSHYTILRETLQQAGFSPLEDHRLVVLGDAFDRGDETADVAELLLTLRDANRLVYIRGNHEDLMVQCLQQLAGGADPVEIALSHHGHNGTWKTVLALAEMEEREALRFPLELVSRVRSTRVYRELMPAAPDYFELGPLVFVHGYIPCVEHGVRPFLTYSAHPDWRAATPEEWWRARWLNGVKLAVEQGIRVPDKTVVCGHWHTSDYHSRYERKGSEWGDDADFSPYFSPDGAAIGLDACTAVSHTMNCLVCDGEGKIE